MIKIVALVLAFVLLSTNLRAQVEDKIVEDPSFPALEHGSKPARALDVVDTTNKRPFDVLSYKLLLDWRTPFWTQAHVFKGWNTITIAVTDKTDSIVLDAAEMRIDTCWLNGTSIVPAPQPDQTELLTIPLPSGLRNPANPIVLKFAYTRTSETNDGFYFYPKGTAVTINTRIDSTAEDLAYTMSEPYDAHKWMPCMDLPYDKANSEISIIVPEGITAQSNGTLISVIPNPDYSSTFNWKSDEPIATYLMVADASHWVEWRDYYHRLSNPNDSVPVIYYAWPVDFDPDTANANYDAQAALKKTPQMIAAFSARYGEFPFVKYAQVPVQPFSFGGMEHQTITTINRLWLAGHSETGIAHELMHQWFGDKTTCETFRDIWLNESFATFGQAIWRETAYGKASYQDEIAWDSRAYFVTAHNDIPIYNPPIAFVFNYATVYTKGAATLDMLRHYLHNDTLFFNSLRDYSAHFAWSTANTAQFEDFMSRRLGVDLTEFMDSWIYGAGHPIYSITWGQRANKQLTLRVNQLQTVRDHFTMPMQFQVFHNNLIDTIVVMNDARTKSYSFSLNYTADSVRFDSSSVVVSLHSVHRDDNMSVSRLNFLQGSLGLTAQNADEFIECRFSPLEQQGEIALFDIVGNRLVTQSIGRGEHSFRFSYPVASGVYFVRLRTVDGSFASARVCILR